MTKKIVYDEVAFGDYRFLVAVSQKGLVYVDVATNRLDNLMRYLRNSREEIELIQDAKATERYTLELLEYFAGERQIFDLPLDFCGQATAFQQQVWQEIAKVPFGETSSYSLLDEAVGRPTATRAVGSAVGRNPLSIVVPCHRILRKDGGVGGYAGGLPLKYRLLEIENIKVK